MVKEDGCDTTTTRVVIPCGSHHLGNTSLAHPGNHTNMNIPRAAHRDSLSNGHKEETTMAGTSNDGIDHNQSTSATTTANEEDYVDSSAHANDHRHASLVHSLNANIEASQKDTTLSTTSSCAPAMLNSCLLCNSPFNLLLNKKFVCKMCSMGVCRNCATFDDPGWICSVCDQQRINSSEHACQSLICKRLKLIQDKQLVHFEDAKRTLADTFKGAAGQDGNDDGWTDVEMIIGKLLGMQTTGVPFAHIGPIYDDAQYVELCTNYQTILAELLIDLLQIESELDAITTNRVYTRLEEVLASVSEKSFEFPPLRASTHLELVSLVDNSSYESLLASAILNQIVEVSQTRFLTFKSSSCGVYSPLSSLSQAATKHNADSGGRNRLTTTGDYSSPSVSDMHQDGHTSSGDDDHYKDQDEEEDCQDEDEQDEEYIEVEEEEDQEEDEIDNNEFVKRFGEPNFESDRVNFAEAGVDLIDSLRFPSMESDVSIDSGIRVVDNTTSWQDNWLFKKHKDNRSYHLYHLASDIHYGYMALALDHPAGMLIPKPSLIEPLLVGDRQIDQLSDLSDKNSETGSIIFSSDEEEEGDSEEEELEDFTGQDSLNKPKHLEVYLHGQTIQLDHDGRSPRKRHTAQPRTALLKRWSRLKVPDFVGSDVRSSLASQLPSGQTASLEHTPTFVLKPCGAHLHTGIVAQFCCKATGLMPLAFAWYKDGQLIACSDNAECQDNLASPQEVSPSQLARIYFGLKFVHRRYVECGSSGFRLIVFNDNECILEMKRTSVLQSGLYSVVAYNHYGYDWADFRVDVDRVHYAAAVPPPPAISLAVGLGPMSPRPVRRRPQNKKKTQTNELVNELVNNQLERQQLQQDESMRTNYTPVVVNGTPSTNVVQQTWREREAQIVSAARALPPLEAEAQFQTIESMLAADNDEEKEEDKTNSDSLDVIDDSELNSISLEGQHNLASSKPVVCDQPPEPMVMEYAEREHRKWLHPDVSLANNPYSPENIEHRTRQMHSITPELEEEDEISEEDKRKLFYSNRDISKYKRDYYLPKDRPKEGVVFDILHSLSGKRSSPIANNTSAKHQPESYDQSKSPTSLTFENGGACPKITVHKCNSLDSGLTGSSGSSDSNDKNNDDEDDGEEVEELQHKAQAEVEPGPDKQPYISGISQTSYKSTMVVDIAQAADPTPPPRSTSPVVDASYELPRQKPLQHSEIAKLPSVRDLVSRFTSSSPSPSRSGSPSSKVVNGFTPSTNKLPLPRHLNGDAVNGFKVCSLTARSMPRELREQNNKNTPRATNRISLANEMLSTPAAASSKISAPRCCETKSPTLSCEERASASSPSQDSSRPSSRSSTGSNDYRPIKERAMYWNKRMEEGVVSDERYLKPFPTMDGSPS